MADRRIDHHPVTRSEDIASRLPPLLVAAEKVARSISKGVHGRRRVGMGESFWQFRPYETGDSLRDVDWRQSGKRDTAYIRQTEWEAAQTIWLYRDASDSMSYTSDDNRQDKGDYADVLLMAVSMLLLEAGEQVGILGGGSLVRHNNAAVMTLYEHLKQRPDWRTAQHQPVVKYSTAIVFSDLWMVIDDLEEKLRYWSEQGMRGVLVHTLDPAERDFPFTGRLRIVDSDQKKQDAPLLIDNAQEAAELYRQRFQNHVGAVQKLCAALGWRYIQTCTNDPAQISLLKIYDAMTDKGGRL